ncbi:MAG: N-acetyltransferase [Bacteroides sp.]|nr:N-acetyltransferase [Bacteroides sp.]
MKGIMIKKVETKEDMDDFVNLPNKLYATCPYYVPDLEMDVRNTFNPKKNAGLEFSDIQAFLAFNEQGKAVGRIAGIINHRANKKWNTRNVRFGFFDFIDDLQVSAALLNTVAQWGREQGMENIQGPMGITDFDKEGMLIEDFDQMGSMNTLYNYPYYPQHMEILGYEKEVDWIQVRIDIPKETPAKYARVARLSKEMFDIKVKKINDRDITQGGYGHKIFHLLNESYSPIFGFTEFTDRQIDDFVKQYLGLVDKRLVTVVENDKNEVVGVAVSMCSLSDALRKSAGKLFPFGWYHLLKALKWKPEKHADLLLIAVRPDYQMLGVNALFFDDLIPIYNKHGIRWAETGPQLEDNFRELTQWKPLNPTFTKRRRCYKKKIMAKNT